MKKNIFIVIAVCFIFVFSIAESAPPTTCKKCYCTVTATNLNFGSYDGLAQLAVDSVGTIDVECGTTDKVGSDINYEISLLGVSGPANPRVLTQGASNTLDYNIYTDATYTTVWGDGNLGSAWVSDSYIFTVQCCEIRSYTMYGRIFSGQNVSPGVFSDTVTVSVLF